MRKDIYDELMADVNRGHVEITPANHTRLRRYEREIRRQMWMDRFRELLWVGLGIGLAEVVRGFAIVWQTLHTVAPK